MRKRSFLLQALGILMAVLSVMSLFPMAASATQTTGLLISGSVRLNGASLGLQDVATVIAVIPGVSDQWSKEVTFYSGESHYVQLLIPMNSGTGPKNGGNNGDVIFFKLIVNGHTYIDATTMQWWQGAQLGHDINVNDLQLSNLVITTASLAAGQVGTAYSQALAATGGSVPYVWSWDAGGIEGLPAGLNISSTNGNVSGTPTLSGNYSVVITVEDALHVTVSKTFILSISTAASTLAIVTADLPCWVTEVFPANAPVSWVKPMQGWIIGIPYAAMLAATGGVGAYNWSAANLPPGLAISANGTINGTPTAQGEFEIVFTVQDSATPPNSISKALKLKIYLLGDANGNGTVSAGDIAYDEKAILGLLPATAGCDADANGKNDVADITWIEKIILNIH